LENKINILDDYLDAQTFKLMQDQLLSDDFPWFGGAVLGDGPGAELGVEEKYNFQFTHMFYMNPYTVHPTVEIIKPLIDSLSPLVLIKAKANLNPVTPFQIEHGFHIDIVTEIPAMYTAVFYLNTNNGYTKFEDGTTVESIANRLVIFPTELMHTGSTCTDVKARCVLNLNFIKVE
jgi:hypothetical protein